MASQNYNYHAQTDVSWICCTCGLPNFSTSLFESLIVDTSNVFDSLNMSMNTTGNTTHPGSPLHTSSPTREQKSKQESPQHSFRIISLNLQSIRAKKASFMNLVDSAKPDIIVRTESWLRPDIHNSEFTAPGYTVIARRDRQNGYGRVFIMTKSNTPFDELYTSKQSELVAISVGRNNNQPLVIAGLYRPPRGTQDQAEQICTEVQELVRNHASAPFWLTGDFNLPDISWKHNISGNQNALGVNNAFLTLLEDVGLQQMVDFPASHLFPNSQHHTLLTAFKNGCLNVLGSNVPSKMTTMSDIASLGSSDKLSSLQKGNSEPTILIDTKSLNLPKTMPTTNISRMWYTVLVLSGTMSMSMTL
jgi:exonuclease III